MSLETLDPKCSLNFLENVRQPEHISKESVCNQYKGGNIWAIDDFLSPSEIFEILETVDKHYEYLEYRNSYRCIGIDNNHVLSELIKTRLNQNDFVNKLNGDCHVTPRGFVDPNIVWLPNDGTVNSCIRVNKYIDSEFGWHRDASLTCNPQLRSNYTIVVYLTQDFFGGYTEFLVPRKEYYHSGLSMKEELELIGDEYDIFRVSPKIGRAVIFDHGLIHRSSKVTGTKCVLRTDLICKGNKLNNEILATPLFKSLENLTIKLFRCAQLNELQGLLSGELYERCLSLRMNPISLTDYPLHLEDLINTYNINKNLTSSLRLISRSCSTYKFKYSTVRENKFELLKQAILFALNSLTVDITDKFIKEFNEMYYSNITVNSEYEHVLNQHEINIKKFKKLEEKESLILQTYENKQLSKKAQNKLIKIRKELNLMCKVRVDNKKYFSNQMGKYNMLDNVSDSFVTTLAQSLRVRSNGTGRSAFDLITSVLINEHDPRKLSQSKALLKVGETRFTDLPMSFFKKEFDSSLYSVLRRLFINFNIKYDEKMIKHMTFSEINKQTFQSASTVVQLIGHEYNIKIFKEIYSPYDRKRCIFRDINIDNAFCFHQFKFTTIVGDCQLNFHNVSFNCATIHGKVVVDAPTCYFNHAACQSDVVTKHTRNIKRNSPDTLVKYMILKHNATFTIDSDHIVITIIPHVVV